MGRKILFVTSDQQRYDALGCTAKAGTAVARTPTLDGLARDGVIGLDPG
jgi:arylsulfatase A-like enzyme